MSEITFGVITQVPEPAKGGNLASCFAFWPDGSLATVALSNFRTEVFTRGEVLVLGPDGREISGKGRKPGKWRVTCEEFDTIEEAVASAREVRTW